MATRSTKAKVSARRRAVKGKSSTAKRTDPQMIVPKRLRFAANEVLACHSEWMDSIPEGTVGELRERIEKAIEQCHKIADRKGDPHIDSYKRIPEPLLSELHQWDNSGPECTFSYRLANLEDLQMNLEELEEVLEPEFLLSAFRSTEQPTACSRPNGYASANARRMTC